MDTIGRVYELIGQLNMSLLRLSRESDVAYSTFATCRRRGGELKVETIERICRALGISLSEFFAEDARRQGPVPPGRN